MLDAKKCRGPLHREGVWLPLRRFSLYRSGPLAGKPTAACIQCRAVYNGHAGYQVKWDEVRPVIDALIVRLKTKSAICEALGWNRATLSRGFASLHSSKFEAMRELLADLQAEERHFKQGEAEVVEAEPFGAVLRLWVKRWLAERPRGDSGNYMGPVDWLAEKTGIHVRRVAGISNSEFPFVPLTQADAILSAIGEDWRFGPAGDIQVIPNPQWTFEWWYAYMCKRGCY